MNKTLSFLWETLKVILLALVVVVPIRYFIFQPFVVKGISMEPSFSTGDYLIVDELSYRFREPERGEIIVFKYPDNPKEKFIKRIIGLPGEIIELEDNKVSVNGELIENEFYINSKTPGKVKIELKTDEYFVMGDNREHSFDSRSWGALPEEFIIGRTMLRLFPPNKINSFTNPEY